MQIFYLLFYLMLICFITYRQIKKGRPLPPLAEPTKTNYEKTSTRGQVSLFKKVQIVCRCESNLFPSEYSGGINIIVACAFPREPLICYFCAKSVGIVRPCRLHPFRYFRSCNYHLPQCRGNIRFPPVLCLMRLYALVCFSFKSSCFIQPNILVRYPRLTLFYLTIE